MRIVINEAQIKRNRQLSHAMFFISLAGMGIGFYYSWTADPEGTASQISCFVLPVLMLLTLTSVRMANTWIREPRPTEVLAESLRGLGKKYTIFHYLMPAPHVLIGPEGVFVLTTVWQEGEFEAKGKRWYGDNGIARRLVGFLRQDLIGNPFNDASFQAQQVQRLIDKIAPDKGIEVQPLIVFINPNATVETEEPLFPVIYADSKKKPSLRDYIRQQGENTTLEEAELDRIDEMFRLVTRHEVAAMLGEGIPIDEDDDSTATSEVVAETPASANDDSAEITDEAEGNTVYLAQAGQLYYIGATQDSPKQAIMNLGLVEEVGRPVEVIHTFESANADAAVRELRHKYNRKRQKEHWYGLSKKDVAWFTDQDSDPS